ncbi:MAG: hypothetical protein BWY09_02694 [Candidatus Hydrogenedentes bacterium ADurb.Bin179]|nr:MAG: hypothetical protein BWY09_02694 [Candidatus Hydrogenedentes bacterium ADurb.Bin179]
MKLKFTGPPSTKILNPGNGTNFQSIAVPYSSLVGGHDARSGTGVCWATAMPDMATTNSPINKLFFFMIVTSSWFVLEYLLLRT